MPKFPSIYQVLSKLCISNLLETCTMGSDTEVIMCDLRTLFGYWFFLNQQVGDPHSWGTVFLPTWQTWKLSVLPNIHRSAGSTKDTVSQTRDNLYMSRPWQIRMIWNTSINVKIMHGYSKWKKNLHIFLKFMHLKMPPGNCQPFCPGLNMLKQMCWEFSITAAESLIAARRHLELL